MHHFINILVNREAMRLNCHDATQLLLSASDFQEDSKVLTLRVKMIRHQGMGVLLKDSELKHPNMCSLSVTSAFETTSLFDF